MANPTAEQLGQLLMKEKPAPWCLRDAADLQSELNDASPFSERVITHGEASRAHKEIQKNLAPPARSAHLDRQRAYQN
jgi:hypothetical protein